jgi:hypothetical protein
MTILFSNFNQDFIVEPHIVHVYYILDVHVAAKRIGRMTPHTLKSHKVI